MKNIANSKIAKKEIRPIIRIDMSRIETLDDINWVFAEAKLEAGLSINLIEVESIVNQLQYEVQKIIDFIHDDYEIVISTINHELNNAIAENLKLLKELTLAKRPWYKKLWHSLKYAFTW